MTIDSTTPGGEPVPDPVPVEAATPEAPGFSQELQDLLDKAASERVAAEAAARARQKSEEEAIAELAAAKAVCEKSCAEIAEAIARVDPNDFRTITALQDLERTRHEPHREQLEAAYRKFSGQREGDSNPAMPGVNDLDTHATMSQQVEGTATTL